MSNSVKFVNIMMFLMIMVGDFVYICTDVILAKAITSALFVILGVLDAIYLVSNKAKNQKFMYLMLAGLFFAFLGDVVLEVHFIMGAVLFALGHVLFFVAYIFLNKFCWSDLICWALIFIPSVLIILFVPTLKFESILMQMVCVVYALIISLMLSKSVSNFIKDRSVLNSILLVGSILFFFSDLMLLFSRFGGVSTCGLLCLLTYYPAEFLLAFSILFAKEKQSNNQKS